MEPRGNGGGRRAKDDSRPRELPAGWDRLEEEAARLWMAEVADAHPYLLQFSGARKAAIRASLESLIEARVPHVWTDAAGRRVPWRIRPAAWELALGMAAREGGRLENLIRLVALPQLLDPFKVRTSSELGQPAASGGALSRIDLPANLSGPAVQRIREWAAAHPAEAEQLADRMLEDPKWGGSTQVAEQRRRMAGQGFTIEATRRARASA